MEVYGTPESVRARKRMRKFWPGYKIVDPERLDWKALEAKHGVDGVYVYVIKKSDVVVVLEYDDMIGKGVFTEVKEALLRRKPVYVLRGNKFYAVKSIKYVGINWIFYGKLDKIKTLGRRDCLPRA
jgi:hypothetical protein